MMRDSILTEEDRQALNRYFELESIIEDECSKRGLYYGNPVQALRDVLAHAEQKLDEETTYAQELRGELRRERGQDVS